MWVIMRVVVLLPLVPLMLTMRAARARSSLIISGADAGRLPEAFDRARQEPLGGPLGELQRGLGDQLGLLAGPPADS